MKLVVYHAEAAHPDHDHGIYEKLWPVFMAHAHEHGYEVTQLTSEFGTQYGDHVLRFPIEPALPMFSREVCWVEYLKKHADPQEQHCLLEPDMVIRRPIPELPPGKDFMLLDRTGDILQPSLRVVRLTALPFYEHLLDMFKHGVPMDKRAWYGDCHAMHMAFGLPADVPVEQMPAKWRHLDIDVRSQHDYGNTWPKNDDAYIWHFKGTSKSRMK
jgi:hypothetical protein